MHPPAPSAAPESDRSAPPVWVILLLCAFSGAIQAVISPPLNLVPLHLFSWVPALWVFGRLTPGRALLAGWWTGAVAHLAIFYWVVHTVETFTAIPVPVAILILGAFSAFWGFYVGIFAWGYAAIRRASGPAWPLAIAAFFVACEYLNPQLFPFYQGVAWYQQPWMFLLVSLTGIPAITFGVLLLNALLVGLLERRLEGRPLVDRAWLANASVFAAGLVFAVGWSQVRLARIAEAEAAADPIKVALVQQNRDVFAIAQLRRAGGKNAIINDLVDLAQEAAEAHDDIDAFVFAEGALRGGPARESNWRMLQLAEDTGAEIWTGGTDAQRKPDGDIDYFNSGYRIYDGGKQVDARYDKNILLPFGEFMPFVDVLPFLKKIRGPGAYARGDGLVAYDSPHARFVFLICYEAIRHRYVRGGVRMGADLLVNVTYDDWYGDGAEQSQHLMLSAIQGALYGVPLIRATTTGISATVDARGMIGDTTRFRERTVLVSEVRPLRVPSPYAVLGDWFAWLCILAGSALLVRGWWQRPRRSSAFRGIVPIGIAVLGVPMNWAANPYLPWGDRISWVAVVTAVVLVAWRQRKADPA